MAAYHFFKYFLIQSDRALRHLLRKAYADSRPNPSTPRIQPDLRTMPLGDLGHDGEAEAAAALAAAEDAVEAFEHAFAVFRRDAGAVVFHV